MRHKPVSRQLKPITRLTYPELFCFVDTESTLKTLEGGDIQHDFRIGVAIFARFDWATGDVEKETLYFHQPSVFWHKVHKAIGDRGTIYVVAHNIVYDMHMLRHIQNLDSMGYLCQAVFNNGLTFIAKWKRGRHRIILLNNTNWFQGKLEKWGTKLGYPKLKMPGDAAPMSDWFTYCHRDTDILFELTKWLITFLRANDLGPWKFTLAGIALSVYRYRFMHHPIYIPTKSPETPISRGSYRGGRTECLYKGVNDDGPFYKLDVNSMYPSVMTDCEYPVNLELNIRKPTIAQLTKALLMHCVIADVWIRTTEPFYPITYEGKTVYPIGKFRATLTSPELTLALDRGWIIKINQMSVYRRRPIFSEYVAYFYDKKNQARANGDELSAHLYKLLLNSLYGKFGQRKYVDRIMGTAPMGTVPVQYTYNPKRHEHGVIRQIGTNVIQSIKQGEGHNAFVAIASHVTAYARVRLYELVVKAGREHVYYMDTDSLIVDSVGYARLTDDIDVARLGALKLEGTADSVEILAPKHYRFGEETKIKGVSKDAPLVSENTYRVITWPKFNSLIKMVEGIYLNRAIIKHIVPSIKSGVVLPNGHITPLSLNIG